MILTKQTYKTAPNGKTSWRGFLNFDKRTAEKLGLDQKEIFMVLLDEEDVDLSKEEFAAKLYPIYEKFNKWVQLQIEIEKLKED